MIDLTDKIVGEMFAECPDHQGAHLYRGEDAAGIYWACPHGCDPLSDRDVYIEWNERHSGRHDGTDVALHIIELEPAHY